MSEATRAYVILEHLLEAGSHWDLMLEQEQALATWQLTTDPAALAGPDARQSLPARRIADHRRAYLTYEGPVSGGRGSVRRVDEGRYELLARTEAGWRVRFTGRLLAGVFELASGHADEAGRFHRVGDA